MSEIILFYYLNRLMLLQ